MTQPLLRTEQLSVYYGEFRALRDVSIAVGEDEIISIIGANGAGKSSLLRAIVGQAARVRGAVFLAGTNIVAMQTKDIVQSGIALVPEGRRLFPSLTVEENLQIGVSVGRPGPIGFASIFELFPVLADKRKEKARNLSGGQQQMVAIGRALLTNPRVLLCDEISLGLAPIVIDQIYKAVPKIRAEGTSIVLVEQDLTRSLAIADRFYCLLEGRISLSGRPGETRPDLVTAAYFGTERT